MTEANTSYARGALDSRIRVRHVDNGNGLTMHVLEAGDRNNPCVLLLHGFPELAYSWRKVILPLADAGYYVVAPDQRGYGRTTGSDDSYHADVGSFRLPNLVRDALGLVYALQLQSVHAVVGHDFGSSVAAWCSVIRPDVFRSVVMMSAPFAGTPAMPAPDKQTVSGVAGVDHSALAALAVPRKHYQWYYSTEQANDNMQHCEQGVHDFLRAYYHHKSADWPGNNPLPLDNWGAESLAQLPTYYVMDLNTGMAETVATQMPTADQVAQCEWLTSDELSVYSGEFDRRGFQGGLNWYRCVTSGDYLAELQLYCGLTIDVPSAFISGQSDWGTYQKPGEYESMQNSACTKLQGCYLLEGAGHWVQQEQSEQVCSLLTDFLQRE